MTSLPIKKSAQSGQNMAELKTPLRGRLAWAVALPAEAKPIIRHLGLKRSQSNGPFPVYHSACGEYALVVSGVGRNRMSAAVVHLYHVLGQPAYLAWLNVGIAGHKESPLGSAFMISQAREASSGAAFYPHWVFDSPLPLKPLCTVDAPQRQMQDDALYDMEGTAFFDTASRLSCAELVASVKLVSDHGDIDQAFPNRQQIGAWIDAAMDNLDEVAKKLLSLSAEEVHRMVGTDLQAYLDHHHFSVTQRHQLSACLRRWRALGLTSDPLAVVSESASGKAAIRALEAVLNAVEIQWGNRP